MSQSVGKLRRAGGVACLITDTEITEQGVFLASGLEAHLIS